MNLQEETIIRDAEIEDVLKSYIQPIFKAATLNPKDLRLYVIFSKVVNAFAMGGGKIGINTGLLLRANSSNQVVGVLAHETAHLADHHIIRGLDAYQKALTQNLLTTLGGIAAGVAGSPELATAILMGSQELALRGLLKFTRTQEGAADQGGVRFLEILGWSSKGMLEFFEILHKDTFISSQQVDPYVLTHPLTPERMDFVRNHITHSKYTDVPMPDLFEKNFKRIQTKIAAFTDSPAKTLSHYSPADTSLLARYARAIAYFQMSHEEEALAEINDLLREFPDDAFFWDFKAQILLDSGKIQDAMEAYEKAVSLRPDIPLFHLSLAHTLLESGNPAYLEKAYRALLRVRHEEPDNPFVYQLLAIYYGKTGKTGLAALALGEMAFETGDFEKGRQQCNRALKLLEKDSENKARAQHILDEIDRNEKKKGWIDLPYSAR